MYPCYYIWKSWCDGSITEFNFISNNQIVRKSMPALISGIWLGCWTRGFIEIGVSDDFSGNKN